VANLQTIGPYIESQPLNDNFAALNDDIVNVPHALYRNAIINGNFDVWQRGTSFDNVSAGTYTADRWKVSFNNVSNNVKVLRSTTVPNANSRYSLRVEQMGSTGASGDYSDISQPIEDAALFSGKKVVFSGWVKCDAGRSVTPLIFAGGNVYVGTPISATSFTQFSFVQQLPAGISSLSFILRVNRGGAAVGEGVNIAQVQVNVGDVVLPFQPRHLAEELALCQRYYQRGLQYRSVGTFYTASAASIIVPHIVPMRIAPTLEKLPGISIILDDVGAGSLTTSNSPFNTITSESASRFDVDGFTGANTYRFVRLLNDSIYLDAEL